MELTQTPYFQVLDVLKLCVNEKENNNYFQDNRKKKLDSKIKHPQNINKKNAL
jgi:hypothetical protein